MMHYKITITGRVQGVFFRKYTVEKAQELGLKGFVKNNPNGDVYCEVEGEVSVLKQFTDWCHRGSPLSKVMSVEVIQGELKNFDSFTITR